MHKFVSLLCGTMLLAAGDDVAHHQQISNGGRARRISERISGFGMPEGKTIGKDIEIRVGNDTVHVVGAINDADDARFILEAILAEPDVKNFHLSLSTGDEPPEPSRLYRPLSFSPGMQKLEWDDSHWQRRFQGPTRQPKTRVPSE